LEEVKNTPFKGIFNPETLISGMVVAGRNGQSCLLPWLEGWLGQPKNVRIPKMSMFCSFLDWETGGLVNYM